MLRGRGREHQPPYELARSTHDTDPSPSTHG